MNCPPPSHSMWVVFCCCVRTFFWIGYRIIEFIGHLSSVKILKNFDDDSEEKWGMFFLSFFFVGVQEKRNIYFTKKKEKKVLIGI